MAVIKLGAIVTGIAGSIGGTTFRRTKNGLSAYNKAKGPGNSIVRSNQRLNFLRARIQAWAGLTASDREEWEEVAPSFLFPDKFGDLKALSGRQLFIKLSTRASLTELPVPDPQLLNSTVPEVLDAFITATVDMGTLNITFEVSAAAPMYFVFGFQTARPTTRLPDLAKFVIFGYVEYTSAVEASEFFIITDQYLAKLPEPAVGQFVSFVAFPQNADGFRGSPIVRVFPVELA